VPRTERSDGSARAAGAAVANLKGTQAGYIEDGAFTKLREVSITYFRPRHMGENARASDLSFSVVGRNLATWTKYKGVDPELNEAGQNNFTTADFLTQLRPVLHRTGHHFLLSARTEP